MKQTKEDIERMENAFKTQLLLLNTAKRNIEEMLDFLEKLKRDK